MNNDNPMTSQNPEQGDSIDGARQMAQDQVDNVIDQYADKVPGGEQFKGQAKETVDGALKNLQQQGEKQMEEQDGLGGIADKLGGLFGGNKDNS